VSDHLYRIVALPGEGIGPEVLEASLRVLDRLCALEGLSVEVERALIGQPAIDAMGEALPPQTIRLCREADAILFGAVARHGILEIRREFDFYINLRPIRVPAGLAKHSALRPELAAGVDMVIVRELASGIYFGPSERGQDERGAYGSHAMKYYDFEIRRIARHALQLARKRSGRLTVAHKENALPKIKWQELVAEEARQFPDVEVKGMLVDSLAMELVRQPKRFDVILAGNLFGDILSDLGGAITGSLGLLPSASLNDAGLGLFEPVHGTAPDIAGKGIANPMGMLSSVEMMLEHWNCTTAADRLRRALDLAVERGICTPDMPVSGTRGAASTDETADAIAELLEEAQQPVGV
jgi:3-isopropylmalate dehydrogenase/3-benzylmalate dehydrogenase